MKIDKSYYITNLTPELSLQIQEICFRDGFTAPLAGTVAGRLHFPHIEIDFKQKAVFRLMEKDVESEGYEEVTPQEFISKFKAK